MPTQPTSQHQLLAEGLAAFNRGRLTEAEAAFSTVLAADPESADAHHLLGLVALRSSRAGDAVDSIARSIALNPREPSYRSNHAVALKATGRRDEAITALREAIRIAPSYVQAHVNLGNTLREDGDLAAAAEAYRSALRHAPDAPAILNNLGNVHRELGELDEAAWHYRRAIAIAPDYAEALSNLASAEMARGAAIEAVALLERAVLVDPRNDVALMTLGSVLLQLDRHGDAEAAYRRAVAMAPQRAEAHAGLADVLVRRGQVADAIAAYETALAQKPDFAAARSGLIFMRNYEGGGDPFALTDAARAFGAMLPRLPAPPVHANSVDPDRPLTIGLVSGDLRNHAVATFLMGVIPAIDASRYRIVAYATSAWRDGVTERLTSKVSAWHEAGRLSDAALAARVAADGIDILVDLSGHTMFNRLPVLALKPAPVQMSWLGYSGTTGVAEIDYVLGDRFVTPIGDEAQLVETPWRMPDSYLCWSPPEHDVPVGPLPAERNGFVTFGSFNNIGKLSDRTVALWAQVLDAVPTSRLLLKAGPLGDPATAEAVRDRFAGRGIGAERMVLAGRVADAAGHLATYGEVDIGLDPVPYNGTTTTAEALWMGVPVLTLRGDRFIAHVGESMLATVGLPQWVAADAADFVRKAADFAADRVALTALRAGLRAQLLSSPLCDGPRFARHLEAAWRGMWQAWCASQRA